MASVGELWLVWFGRPFPGEPVDHRPALVVGPPTTFGPSFPAVFVVPATTRGRGLPLHVEVEANEATGLDQTSYLQCELLSSVGRERLVRRLGAVDRLVEQQVSAITRMLLGH